MVRSITNRPTVSFHGVPVLLGIAVLVCSAPGCGKSTEDARIDNPPDLEQGDRGTLASEQIAPAMTSDSGFDPLSGQDAQREPNLNDYETGGFSTERGTAMAPIPGEPTSDSGIVGQSEEPFRSPLTIAPAESEAEATEPASPDDTRRLQLRPDLTPAELVDFLGEADQYMQLLFSGRGISDRQEAFEEMNRVAKVKLEASRRLTDAPDATDREKVEGARGEMQSLSHLAAQGDIKAADELEKLASENLNTNDSLLVADSRVVLIGFAIEALQAGKKDAADRIVTLVQSVESSDAQPDVPALMMMGHARGLLAQYGFDEQAVRVRDRILKLFASSSNPEIAKMAAQAAGNVRFDAVEKLRASIVAGTKVAPAKWAESVTELIDDAPDLVTVQYLAGAALEFEAASVDELANTTYQLLQDRFDDPKAATGFEVGLAVKARAAREAIIGNRYAPQLPSINGAAMPLSDYRGKIILMPFWATGFSESLQVVPKLKDIQAQHPDDVVIIGMNLDPAETRVEEFEPDKQLGFPSYRSVSSADKKGGNPVAEQFGMVSMPFVAILDQDQRIVALDFTGSKLKSTVDKLLQ